MPSDSKTDDRRPAATEAAREVIDRALDEAWDKTNWTDAILDALSAAGLTFTAAPPSGRAACSTCGETGVDHDGFACRDCDGQGSTPIAVPPSGQVCVSVEDLDYAIGDWNANKNLTERGEAIRDRLRAALKGASE